MAFTIFPYRHFPVRCAVTCDAGPVQGQGTVWNLFWTWWRLSGDLPVRLGETLSLTVTLPNEQRIAVSEPVVQWLSGEAFAVETRKIEEHTQARLQHYVKQLVKRFPPPTVEAQTTSHNCGEIL